MINGAHIIIYSKDAEADRAFFKDVLGFPSVDAGHGWLIFSLPPAEVACHPADDEGHDVGSRREGCLCSEPEDLPWGLLTRIKLPGGGELGLYQPKHARPPTAGKTQP